MADDDGADSLTMRGLADRLGFKVMALYNHITGKEELLSLMVDAVASGIEAPSNDADALQAVRAHAIATREAFVRHPWAPDLWQRHVPGPGRTDQMEILLRLLDECGLPDDVAHLGFHAVNNHVLGYTLQELAMDIDTTGPDAASKVDEFLAATSVDTHPLTVAHVHQHLRGDTSSSFVVVLDIILDGLVRLGRESQQDPAV